MMADRSRPASTGEQARGEKEQLLARSRHDVLDRLGAITCPTLVASGRYDGIAPVSNGEAIATRVPGAELRVYEGGHAFFVQDPRRCPRSSTSWPAERPSPLSPLAWRSDGTRAASVEHRLRVAGPFGRLHDDHGRAGRAVRRARVLRARRRVRRRHARTPRPRAGTRRPAREAVPRRHTRRTVRCRRPRLADDRSPRGDAAASLATSPRTRRSRASRATSSDPMCGCIGTSRSTSSPTVPSRCCGIRTTATRTSSRRPTSRAGSRSPTRLRTTVASRSSPRASRRNARAPLDADR